MAGQRLDIIRRAEQGRGMAESRRHVPNHADKAACQARYPDAPGRQQQQLPPPRQNAGGDSVVHNLSCSIDSTASTKVLQHEDDGESMDMGLADHAFFMEIDW
eukprot:CAMPEP_0174931326 /NCGR_PEP_ID=MMETSP1355-20121228/33161_1 /TAXON_ID=464990 /ORGANISM="Hemiselmis tepida, Strain CCMP443" /LENGTH=102 /DNA_ID=CAMNT_0016177671 /DNA_START=264 /DNA_END=569 /DNA_ORIENTATION=+